MFLFIIVFGSAIVLGYVFENHLFLSEGNDNYKIKIITPNTGADITRNTVFTRYIPRTELTYKLISVARNGTPMIIFGNGSGPRVMVVAGTHGAELPSQIAVLKLINFLNGKKIRGTVYIVPFVIPNNTANNSRLDNGKDPNRVAHIPGSPTHSIAYTAKNYNMTFFGDFHSTRPNHVPGKKCIIYHPDNPKSYKLAKYIKNRTNSPLSKIAPYPGVLTTVTNNNGITSVTCEVLSPDGTVESGSCELAYRYMVYFLEYCKIF